MMGIFDSDFKVAKFLKSLTRYGTLTLRPAVGILLGFFLGQRGDDFWGTEPLLAIAGALVGLLLGLFFLYRVAMEEITGAKSSEQGEKNKEKR